ncbi:MAG: FadR/GntR family transcriptional regulator [Inquilinaceae bacterium]
MSDQFGTARPVRPRPAGAAAHWGNPWLVPVQAQGRDGAVLDTLALFVFNTGIRPGERLPPERDLAERLGVSRATIREALKRWQGLGVVDIRKGSGTYLRTPVEPGAIHMPLTLVPKPETLLQTLEIRRALEGEAAFIAARGATPEALADIEAKLDRMEAVHRRYGGAGDEDWAFHRAIYEATGNPLFGQIIGQMHDALQIIFRNPLRVPGFASRSFPLHREMFDAIRTHDADGARAKALAIIDITEQDIRRAIDAR